MSEQVISFTVRAKEEIYAARPLRGGRWLSFAYGLFLFGAVMDAGVLTLTTEHKVTSLCYADAFKMITGHRLTYHKSGQVGGRVRYKSSCADGAAIAKLREALGFDLNRPLDAPHMRAEGAHPAFLAGAFMACASLTDPAREYHLAFKPAAEAAGDCLFELLAGMGYPPKTALYRGEQMLYYKESGPIEDLLTLVGAPICALELMEVKVWRDLRNKANRITNAETANIEKIVASSAAQIEDIAYIKARGQAELLPPELAEMAELRLLHPEASLRELGGLCAEPISRSGVNHRLKRLGEWAADLRRRDEAAEK